MAPKRKISRPCSHDSLISEPSPFASEAGYNQAPPSKLLAATLPSGRIPNSSKTKSNAPDALTPPGTFLAPLVLPGDDLADDPKCPPQSLRSFIQEKARNPMTRKRSTIYVIGPPNAAEEVKFVDSWIHPSAKEPVKPTKLPEVEHVVSYLSAFYHPIPVKLYSEPLTFTAWSDDPKPKSKANSKTKAPATTPQHIGLASTTSCTRIRCRPCPPPSSTSSPIFPMQLNLSDLCDTLLTLLPTDAYSILLLTHHDIYESPDDDFVCGRAYGGSRIAVVSSARYRPELDDAHGVDPTHAWPASHCKAYVESLCGVTASKGAPRQHPTSKTSEKEGEKETPIPPSSPIALALQAFKSPPPTIPNPNPIITISSSPPSPPTPSNSASTLLPLHLHRLLRTSTHELGHTLGLAHCVYHACLMQSTASLAEDARQPPVFCRVCERKLEWGVGEWWGVQRIRGTGRGERDGDGDGDRGEGWKREREGRLVEECERWGRGEGGEGWRAMGAWVEAWVEARARARARIERGRAGGDEGGDGGASAGSKRRKVLARGREDGVDEDDDGDIEIVDLT